MPATPVHDTAVIDEPWDGSAQESKLNTPVTGAAGKAMYGWYDESAPDGDDDGYPDAKGAWKLPHHDVSDAGTPGAANVPGVRAALSRLGQSNTKIPDEDKAAVRRHLQHHLDAFNQQKNKKADAPEDQLEAHLDLSELPRVRVAATAAITEEFLPLVRAVAQSLTGSQLTASGDSHAAGRARGQMPGQRVPAAGKMVAVLPLQGVITPRGSLLSRLFGFGCGGLEGFREGLRMAIADPDVSAIVLDIDSPGGLIDMVPETAAEIRQARGNGKPIVAVANTWAGSAAYWLAAQADELVVTPSGQVGSIGVYTIHEDISKLEEMMGISTTLISAGKFKTEGSPFGPLSRGALQSLQSKVDDLYELFVSDIAAGRGVKAEAVKAGYGEGRMVLAAQALPLGMVDRVETLEQTITRLGGNPDEEEPEPDDADPDGDDEPGEPGEPDEDENDAPEGRAESGGSADRLYGEDRREQPAWHL